MGRRWSRPFRHPAGTKTACQSSDPGRSPFQKRGQSGRRLRGRECEGNVQKDGGAGEAQVKTCLVDLTGEWQYLDLL